MAVKPLWTAPPQYVDSSGNPYSSARLFFYAAGSSTKQNVYTDDTGNTAAANPNTLNSSGYPVTSGNVFVPWGTVGQTYKIVLAPPGSDDPPNSTIWTADDIAPINDTTLEIDQWIAGPVPTFISTTSFSLVGDQTSTFHVGRRVKTTNSGGTIYSTITDSTFAVVTTVTVVNDSGVLDAGLSAVSYGLLSYTNPSAPTNSYIPPGVVWDYSGSTVPTGWLECDGSAVSRGTYSALFTAISTAWGAGDGTTTFNLPDFRDRARIGKGTGTFTETITNTEINTGTDTATVASNNTKWITGMQITWGVTGTPPTTNPANLLDNSDTVFIIRTGATTVKFATTLANAQNGTAIDITNAGSGTFTMTHTFTARTLAEYGGQESHAISSTEQLAHTHTSSDWTGGNLTGGGGSSPGTTPTVTATSSTGGNAAMNIMLPFAVTMAIIKT